VSPIVSSMRRGRGLYSGRKAPVTIATVATTSQTPSTPVGGSGDSGLSTGSVPIISCPVGLLTPVTATAVRTAAPTALRTR